MPLSSDLRLPEGLLHLLEELQLGRRLLQLALQDLAPDAPWRWDKNEAEQAAEPTAGQIQGQTERGKEGPRQEVWGVGVGRDLKQKGERHLSPIHMLA